jgi:hypothetical protein
MNIIRKLIIILSCVLIVISCGLRDVGDLDAVEIQFTGHQAGRNACRLSHDFFKEATHPGRSMLESRMLQKKLFSDDLQKLLLQFDEVVRNKVPTVGDLGYNKARLPDNRFFLQVRELPSAITIHCDATRSIVRNGTRLDAVPALLEWGPGKQFSGRSKIVTLLFTQGSQGPQFIHDVEFRSEVEGKTSIRNELRKYGIEDYPSHYTTKFKRS